MAHKEHLAILRQGVEVWNRWRKAKGVVPDLSGLSLDGCFLVAAHLEGINLERASLRWANLQQANLQSADLEGANLYWAKLQEANLQHTRLQWANLYEADLTGASLGEVNFQWANLEGADLQKTILCKAQLQGANFHRANLEGAILRGANLEGANLRWANLQSVILEEANLRDASLHGPFLTGADLTHAIIGGTSFDDLDLRAVHGLETVHHSGPSTIGIDTLYRSQGQIPENFLHSCGVPEIMIEYAQSLVAAEHPIDYYSVFISYSSHDEAIAQRLHADLQARGVRCWFAPHDLEIGAPIVRGIDEAIRIYDKLLIILSEAAVTSRWVDFEVSTALHREVEQGRTMLFPIRLDDAVLSTPNGWAAQLRTRHIGDFRSWKDHDHYQAALAQLLRDLKAKEEARQELRCE